MSGLTKDQAMEKIRKLLSGRGRTEEEADTAAILAAAIAAKHDIDISDIDRAEQSRAAIITHQCVGQWRLLTGGTEMDGGGRSGRGGLSDLCSS